MKNIGDYFGEITGDKTSLIAFKNLSNSGAKISAEKELILIAKNITNESTTRGIVHNNSNLDRIKSKSKIEERDINERRYICFFR